MRKMVKVIKRVVELCLEVLNEAWLFMAYAVKRNIFIFCKMLEFSTPYIMWYLAISMHKERGYFSVGGELFIPPVFFFICGVLNKVSEESGQGYNFPVAKKRFTSEDDFGEVTITENDIPEVILYLNDVENYIEKRGMQRWGS